MKKLQTILSDLPIYGDYECSDSDCTHPAVIRHPAEGKFYCAGHAWELAESDIAHKHDLELAATTRKYLLDNGDTCDFCKKLAERICSYCQQLICFSHMHYIPRTGAACPECSEALEQEEERRGVAG